MATKAIYFTDNPEFAEKISPYLKRIGVKTEVASMNGVIHIIVPMRDQDKAYLVELIKNIVKNTKEEGVPT